MEEIRRNLQNFQAHGQACVIATVIEVNGSAYRREGARCLIMPDGEVSGILSGGCIEADLREYAVQIFQTGKPHKVFYDFRAGEDDTWGTGIGCNGAITIWLELFNPLSLSAEAEQIIDDLRKRSETRHPYEAVTVLNSSDEAVYPVGMRWNRSGGDSAVQSGRTAGTVQEQHNGVHLELLVEQIIPRPELIIIGAGDDARLLSSMAKMLQWRVTILYHLTGSVSRERFPDADEIMIIPRLAFEQAEVKGKYVVIMTHNLELDREALRKLLPEDVAYIGLVGSRYRLENILKSMETVDVDEPFDKRLLGKLYSPVGLDIGAETPQEIAMSIMAEATAQRNGRKGGSLRERKGLSLSSMLPPILKEAIHD